MSIVIKSDQEVATMRQAGRIVATVMEVLKLQVRPGMKTEELDVIAATELERLGARPSLRDTGDSRLISVYLLTTR